MMLDFYNAVAKKRNIKPKLTRAKEVNLQYKPAIEKRRSGRLSNQPAPVYNEAALDKIDATGAQRQNGRLTDATSGHSPMHVDA